MQGLTVLAVGAGGDCSVIYFHSPIISFFFLPLSGIDGWVTCGLSPFQQNFSDIRTLNGWWMAVCNGIPFKIANISASSGTRIRDR